VSDSKIYLGADGAYHDDTDENREQFPPAEDADTPQENPEPEAADAAPVVPDAGTESDTGQDTAKGKNKA
jgi:hypothetical protein